MHNFLTRLEHAEYVKLLKVSKKSGMSMAQIIRNLIKNSLWNITYFAEPYLELFIQ